MYGTVRRVLDIWESYFGQRIAWHFSRLLPRLELVPYADWENAHAGFGFLEMGYASTLAWLFTVLVLALTVVQFKLSERWVYYAGGN